MNATECEDAAVQRPLRVRPRPSMLSGVDTSRKAQLKSLLIIGTCAAVALVAGSFLGFGVYSKHIQQNGNFTSTESHTLGIILDLGAFVTGPFVGEIQDRVGPRTSCLVAAVLGGLGYGMVAWGVGTSSGTMTNSIPFLSIGFLMIGASSPLAYISAMYTVTSIITLPYRPLAVATVGVPNGLSAVIVSVSYHYGTQGFSTFFIVWAVMTAIVFVIAAVLLPSNTIIATIDAEANLKTSTGRVRVNGDDEETSPLVVTSKLEGVLKGKDIYEDAWAVPQWLSNSAPQWVLHIVEITSLKIFWILAAPASLVIGASLMVANAASGIADASNEDYDNTELSFRLVIIWSASGVLTRMLILHCMYKFPWPYGMYVILLCVTTAVSLTILAIWPTNEPVLYCGFVLMGCANSMWPITITILRDVIPAKRFGMAVGLFGVIPGLTALIFSYIGAAIYDNHADENNQCDGESCYRSVFVTGAVVVVIALIGSVPLVPRTTKFQV